MAWRCSLTLWRWQGDISVKWLLPLMFLLELGSLAAALALSLALALAAAFGVAVARPLRCGPCGYPRRCPWRWRRRWRGRCRGRQGAAVVAAGVRAGAVLPGGGVGVDFGVGDGVSRRAGAGVALRAVWLPGALSLAWALALPVALATAIGQVPVHGERKQEEPRGREKTVARALKGTQHTAKAQQRGTRREARSDPSDDEPLRLLAGVAPVRQVACRGRGRRWLGLA